MTLLSYVRNRENTKVVQKQLPLICLSLLKLRRLLQFKIPRFLKIQEPLFNEYSKNENKKYDLNIDITVSFLSQNIVGISINI